MIKDDKYLNVRFNPKVDLYKIYLINVKYTYHLINVHKHMFL